MIRFIAALALLAGATMPLRAEVLTIATPGPVSALEQRGAAIIVHLRGSTMRLVSCADETFCLGEFDPEPAPELPQGIVPDGKVAVASGPARGVARAWYASATERYPHGALGDRIEAASLVVETTEGGLLTFDLPRTHVFEDLTPRIADLDGDGQAEIVTIRSGLATGAAIAIYGIHDGRLAQMAVAGEIGTPNRWLNIAGILPTDPALPDGAKTVYAVRTPHLGGVLFSVRYDGARALLTDAIATDLTNHVFGSREQGLSFAGKLRPDLAPNLVIPSQDRRSLRFVLSHHADIRLPGAIDKAILAMDGWLVTATENGRLIAVRH
ncbi:MAG: hypothetical protein KDJ73_06190 [Notoacmeibacter sp.]|nr:hypothetical protein [Notoacmeibacter sp.]MCC0033008.1 hypothetical protein [Brucellaceae bacterium]